MPLRPACLALLLTLTPLTARETRLVSETREIPAGAVWNHDITNHGADMAITLRIVTDQPVVLRVLTAEAQQQRRAGRRVNPRGVLFEQRSGNRRQLETVVTLQPGTSWIVIDNPSEAEAQVQLSVTTPETAASRRERVGHADETPAGAEPPSADELLDVSDLVEALPPTAPAANGLGELPSLDEVEPKAPRTAEEIQPEPED